MSVMWAKWGYGVKSLITVVLITENLTKLNYVILQKNLFLLKKLEEYIFFIFKFMQCVLIVIGL